ncbi:uncharacterized protein TNCV_4988471 [Trichonephila clavipes]|nr:uncharacterized protein TNCV_4988471 [Trichonephila clavipes]
MWGELYRSPGCLHTRTRLSSVLKTNRDSSLNTTFCQSVTFHIDLTWHHCRRSCRCSGVKGSARKGCLDLRFASARCLEIVCGTIATPTSARIVERVTVESTSACRTILRSSLLVVFLVTPDPIFRAWVPSCVHCSQQFLTAHSERSTWPATRHVDQSAVFIPMIRPLSNSLNYEKCLLARLPGMFRLQNASYKRQADAARRFNVSRSVVQRLWDQYQSEDSVSRRPVPGRPRATTPAEDRFLALSARRRRATTVPQLVADHFQASGRRISATTVRNRLHNAGLYARRPVVCVPLNGRQ